MSEYSVGESNQSRSNSTITPSSNGDAASQFYETIDIQLDSAIYTGIQDFKHENVDVLTLPERPPIQSGIIFDPETEFNKVVDLPKNMRKRALTEYKQMYAYQMKGIAQLQNKLQDYYNGNNRIDSTELEAIYLRYAHDYGFPERYNQMYNNICAECSQRHIQIRNLRNLFPDDKKLALELFGFEPKHDVTIQLGPISFIVTFANTDEYACSVLGDDASEDRKTSFRNYTGGAFCTGGKYPGIIIAINAGLSGVEDLKEEFINHEQQHAWYDIVSSQLSPISDLPEVLLMNHRLPEASKKKLITTFILSHLKDMLLLATDEVLAYLSKQGISTDYIESTMLKNSLYDFRSNVINHLVSPVNSNRRSSSMNQFVLEKVQKILLDRYETAVKSSMQAVRLLRKCGYSNDSIRNLFLQKPIDKWYQSAKLLLPENEFYKGLREVEKESSLKELDHIKAILKNSSETEV